MPNSRGLYTPPVHPQSQEDTRLTSERLCKWYDSHGAYSLDASAMVQADPVSHTSASVVADRNELLLFSGKQRVDEIDNVCRHSTLRVGCM